MCRYIDWIVAMSLSQSYKTHFHRKVFRFFFCSTLNDWTTSISDFDGQKRVAEFFDRNRNQVVRTRWEWCATIEWNEDKWTERVKKKFLHANANVDGRRWRRLKFKCSNSAPRIRFTTPELIVFIWINCACGICSLDDVSVAKAICQKIHFIYTLLCRIVVVVSISAIGISNGRGWWRVHDTLFITHASTNKHQYKQTNRQTVAHDRKIYARIDRFMLIHYIECRV